MMVTDSWCEWSFVTRIKQIINFIALRSFYSFFLSFLLSVHSISSWNDSEFCSSLQIPLCFVFQAVLTALRGFNLKLSVKRYSVKAGYCCSVRVLSTAYMCKRCMIASLRLFLFSVCVCVMADEVNRPGNAGR